MKAYREGTAKGWQGVPLRYTMYGEGEPALVCCNGLGVSTFFWKYLIRHFADDHRVVTWDYRGHKKSGYPNKMTRDKFTMGANARDLAGVMDACEIDRAVLIGHSMGVQVILEFWKRYPERAAGLVPVCGPYGRPLDSFFHVPSVVGPLFDLVYAITTAYPRVVERLTRPVLRSRLPYHVSRLGLINPFLADFEDMVPYFDHLSQMDLQVFYLMAGEMQRHNARPWLHKIDVPTLVVGGTHDLFSPLELSIEMRDKIPDAEMLVLPRGSHTGMIEHPELLNLRIEKWIRERVVPFTEAHSVEERRAAANTRTKKPKLKLA